MIAATLVGGIKEFCRTHADSEGAQKYSRYFREGDQDFHAWGLTVDAMRNKARELQNEFNPGPRVLFEAAPALLASKMHEEAAILFLLLEHNLKKLEAGHFDAIGSWFPLGINNWALCDTLCSKVLPSFFLKNKLPLSELGKWNQADQRFQRRAVPVTMVKLLKSTGNYQDLLDLVSPLMSDKERVVHQGAGWFLREAWKKQPGTIEEFLLTWKDHCPRLIIQYATEKMDKEGKLRFKRAVTR